ncbi:MAG: hypothetical protein ACI3XR_04645 [Eubacteriales bacterium]
MKKLLFILSLSLLSLFLLCSCGGKGDATTTAEPDRTTVPTTTSSSAQTTPAVTTLSTTPSTTPTTPSDTPTTSVTTAATTPKAEGTTTADPVIHVPITDFETRLSNTHPTTNMGLTPDDGTVFESALTDEYIQTILTSYIYDYDQADEGFESYLEVLKSYDAEFFKDKMLLSVHVYRGGYELPEVESILLDITPPHVEGGSAQFIYTIRFREPLQKTDCDRGFWVFIEVDRPDPTEYELTDSEIYISCNTSDSDLVSRPGTSYQAHCIETPAQKPINGPYEYRITTYEELQTLLEQTEKEGIFGSELTEALTKYERDFFVTKFLSVVVTEGASQDKPEISLVVPSRNGYRISVLINVVKDSDIGCYHLICELEKDSFGVAPETIINYCILPNFNVTLNELSDYPYAKSALDRWEAYLKSQE